MYILIVISFFQLIWFHIKHRHDISVLKSFNNSPACIYFHSKCLTARLSFELYLCFFIYSFIHSLIHIFFTIIYLFSLYLIYINQVWHFCFESFNNSPACIYFHSKCLTRKIEFLNCIYVYLFIHSFTYSYFFFYYYLFVSLNLIYINQVWHFCFEIVQKYTPHLLPLKVRHRNLELWIDLFKCIFR